MKIDLFWLGVLGVLACSGCAMLHRDLKLTKNGRTSCLIVAPDAPSAVDQFALAELAATLQEATGAEFKVVSPAQAAGSQLRIFVGLSAPVRQILGLEPLAGMADQEHAVKTDGTNVFLYGQGCTAICMRCMISWKPR